VEQELIASVIAVESDFNPRAVSPRLARGLMQLLPQTATRLAVSDVFDPGQNIDAGTRYLKELLARYHQDLALALAAYNAGPDRIEQYRGVPPFSETRSYVQRVTRKLQQHQKRRTKAGTTSAQ
jgi:soluble lytic murein transglycosylase-like protein